MPFSLLRKERAFTGDPKTSAGTWRCRKDLNLRGSSNLATGFQPDALPLCHDSIVGAERRCRPPWPLLATHSFRGWCQSRLASFGKWRFLPDSNGRLLGCSQTPCLLDQGTMWLGRLDSNQRVHESKSCVLPLDNGPIGLVHLERLELSSPCGHQILSLTRIPVPPQMHVLFSGESSKSIIRRRTKRGGRSWI